MASGEDLDDGEDDNNGEPVLTTMKQCSYSRYVEVHAGTSEGLCRGTAGPTRDAAAIGRLIGPDSPVAFEAKSGEAISDDNYSMGNFSIDSGLRLSVLVFDDAGQECTYAKDIESLLGVLAIGLPRTFLKTSLKYVEAFCRATYLGLANIGSLF
ncbi:hypothetical protein RHSIM_Rhsim01G0156900 [Rhododendron simsii]|uniref:Uncharacterized protein n=1 Tax=Rhododendron simsii TaxID=118357 RepID=A0A834HL35_RHOSS|nr:hypothetical protein RHSIM_Rhsim01G0156900 [Rhododendron simsii]